MTKYEILQHFEAFQRGYRAGEVLTSLDVEYWLPQSAREVKLAELTLHNFLRVLPKKIKNAPSKKTPSYDPFSKNHTK